MAATDKEEGIIVDTLFVAVTRPATKFGVTFQAMLFNAILTLEVFLFTKNILYLGMAIPIHGICFLICMNEPRAFDLLALWARTKLVGLFANGIYWKASSYSPLELTILRKPPSIRSAK